MKQDAYVEMAEVQEKHWWFAARRQILASIISRLANGRENLSILEVGCGTGGNLAMLSRFGTVQAVEMNAFAREFAQHLSNLQIVPGWLPDHMPFEDASFDVICLFDVLEHIQDDYAALARIQQLLKPGGAILVTVPAYPWLWSTHDENLYHFRRYTARTLKQLGTHAGLQVKWISYFNTLLFPVLSAARFLDKIQKTKKATATGMPSPGINSVLLKVFAAEEHLLRFSALPFGASLVSIMAH